MTPLPYRFNWFDWLCLWYPPAWLVLFNRHWHHYKPNPMGWNRLECALFFLPFGFYLAFALRWLRLQLRHLWLPKPNQSAQVHLPDLDYQQAFRQEVLAPIVQRYFRATLQSHTPDSSQHPSSLTEQGALIVAMNHAGMCFPWDFVSLGWLLTEQFAIAGNTLHQPVQPFAHALFFDHPWLKWWLPEGWAQVLGGVRADRDSFEAAIAQQTILLYAPEGWRGLAKGWQQRYHLAPFDPSFVRLSLRYRVPILPVICLGNEGLHPFAWNVTLLARWFKLPMFPVSPLIPLFILFPSLGIWAVRSPLRYYTQPLWRPWEELSNLETPRLSDIHRLSNGLRSRLQIALEEVKDKR